MGLREDNQKLRQYARAFMYGELARDDYRRRRRELVDAYSGDPAAPAEVSGTAVRQLVDATAPNLPRAVANAPGQARVPLVDPAADRQDDAPRHHRQGDVWIGLVAVLAVVAVVAGLLAFFM